jgi:hypothetical protein
MPTISIQQSTIRNFSNHFSGAPDAAKMHGKKNPEDDWYSICGYSSQNPK